MCVPLYAYNMLVYVFVWVWMCAYVFVCLRMLSLIWRIGDFVENRQIKNPPILFHTLSLYTEALAIAKFKIHQYILMTDSPNLMLTKVSHYTVCREGVGVCWMIG